jgi:3-phosphoshikimate 1-carboxyvinyltransferase
MKALQLQPLVSPARATLSVPGSKSYTNRALLLAAMVPGPVRLVNPLASDDTQAMVGCLRSLGLEVTERPDSVEVIGDISTVTNRTYNLDADLSGTTMRFMTALCALLPGQQNLRGQPGLEARPIGELVEALRQVGADITYLDRDGYPPLLAKPPHLKGNHIKLSGAVSSQYLSALLMVAPLVGELSIQIVDKLISRPFVDMTIEAMRRFGVSVVSGRNTYKVAGGQFYTAREYAIEGDVSSAAYFFAMAALTRSTVTVSNLNPKSMQADMNFLKILERMGNAFNYTTSAITINGRGVKALKIDMNDCPDQAQTLAVLAAFADGVTTINGIGSLRVKETERIAALQQELTKMDIKTTSTADSLTVHGGQPHGARIATHGDHRMAMAFAVAGSRLPGMVIEQPEVVSKTFPTFWETLTELGISAERIEL